MSLKQAFKAFGMYTPPNSMGKDVTAHNYTRLFKFTPTDAQIISYDVLMVAKNGDRVNGRLDIVSNRTQSSTSFEFISLHNASMGFDVKVTGQIHELFVDSNVDGYLRFEMRFKAGDDDVSQKSFGFTKKRRKTKKRSRRSASR